MIFTDSSSSSSSSFENTNLTNHNTNELEILHVSRFLSDLVHRHNSNTQKPQQHCNFAWKTFFLGSTGILNSNFFVNPFSSDVSAPQYIIMQAITMYMYIHYSAGADEAIRNRFSP